MGGRQTRSLPRLTARHQKQQLKIVLYLYEEQALPLDPSPKRNHSA